MDHQNVKLFVPKTFSKSPKRTQKQKKLEIPTNDLLIRVYCRDKKKMEEKNSNDPIFKFQFQDFPQIIKGLKTLKINEYQVTCFYIRPLANTKLPFRHPNWILLEIQEYYFIYFFICKVDKKINCL